MQSLGRPCSDFVKNIIHTPDQILQISLKKIKHSIVSVQQIDFCRKQITVYNTQNFQGINPPLARLLLSLNHGHKKKGHTVDTTSSKRKELVHCKNQIDKHAAFHTKQITYSMQATGRFSTDFPSIYWSRIQNRNPCLLSILSHFFFVSPS